MNPLETKLSIGGFELTQVQRQGNYAIYAKAITPTSQPFHWEVIEITRRDAFKIGDRDYPASEVYPKNEDWGVSGWTYMSLEAAKAKLASLTTPKTGKIYPQVLSKEASKSKNHLGVAK